MNYIATTLYEFLNEQYKIVDREEFKNTLIDFATLDLEDSQVRYPKIGERSQNHLFSGNDYNLYILDKKELPSTGPFEIIIENDESEVIGFIRGTKSKNIVSFNLIHIKEEFRGSGIGTDIYERFLNDGYIIKCDDEITDSTYSLYDRLVFSGYKPLIFDDGRVGLKKDKTIVNESFKLKSSDKDEINKILRNNYEKYKSDIKKLNNDIKIAKHLMNHVKGNPEGFPEEAFRDSHFDYNSKLEYEKPMLYNKYYDENYKSVERDHIRYKTRNATTNFEYKSKQEDVLKKINYDEYYNSLTNQEKVNIKKFLNNVSERINSGTGESISRKYVRDSFFNTPKSFQQMFSEKPNQYLWRGDYAHRLCKYIKTYTFTSCFNESLLKLS